MAIYAPQNNTARLRRRVTFSIALLIAAIAVAVNVGPQAIAGDGSAVNESVTHAQLDTYTVARGESLWSIAADLTPEGGDVSATVVTIKRLNALSGSQLRAGAQLVIPPID